MADDTFDPRDFDRSDSELIKTLEETLNNFPGGLGGHSEEEVKARFNLLYDAAQVLGYSQPTELVELIPIIDTLRENPRVIACHRENKETIARADWTIDDTIANLLKKGVDLDKRENQIRTQIDDLFTEQGHMAALITFIKRRLWRSQL